MRMKEMIADLRSFDLQRNSPCQYRKDIKRRVLRIWILMLGCKGLNFKQMKLPKTMALVNNSDDCTLYF